MAHHVATLVELTRTSSEVAGFSSFSLKVSTSRLRSAEARSRLDPGHADYEECGETRWQERLKAVKRHRNLVTVIE